MSMSLRHVAIFCGLFILASCTKMCSGGREDLTPEQVVEKYLDVSLNMKSLEEKESLLNLTTGNLHNAITQATDDTVMNAFIKKNYHLDSYSVVERRDRTPRETEITFSLTYRNLGDNKEHALDDAPKITTENTVSVVKENKAWLIRDVIGKKTTIDFPVVKDEIIKPNSKLPGEGVPTGLEDEAETPPAP